MEICNDEHEEIVYGGNPCPLCEAIYSIEELKRENEKLQEKIDKLEAAD